MFRITTKKRYMSWIGHILSHDKPFWLKIGSGLAGISRGQE